MKKKLLVLFLVVAMMLEGIGIVPDSINVSQQSSIQAKSRKVYITPTGKCYHCRKCGRGTYYKVSLKKAKSLGLRACKRCY